jgi:hypothetical protein
VAGNLTIGTGVNFDYGLHSGGTNFNGNVVVNGTLGLNNGAESFTIASGKDLSVAAGGTLNMKSGATLTITGSATIHGTLGGSGGLSTSGTTSIDGTGSFTGPTVVTGGTLTAAATGALGGTSGITISGGGALALSGTGNRINDLASLALGVGGILDLGGRSEGSEIEAGIGALTLAATAGTATIDFGILGGGANTLRFDTIGTRDGKLLIADYDPGVDHLFFTGTASTFSGVYGQNDISFNGIDGFNAIQLGGFYEIAPIPEPSTLVSLIGGAGLLVGYRRVRGGSRRGNGA